MLHLRSSGCCIALLAAVALSAPSLAQSSRGFAADRFEPSERGAEWFALDSLALQGNFSISAGFTADNASRPLVLYNSNGTERDVLIGSQTYGFFGASVVLFDRLRLGVTLPVDLYQSGKDVDFGGVSYSVMRKAALGDVRAGAQVRLVGEYGHPFVLALGASVYFPTGSVAAFASDGKVRIHPELLAAGDASQFTYALRAGFDYHRDDAVFAGIPVGSQVTLGAAAGVRLGLTREWLLGVEVFSNLVLQDFFARRTSSVELLASAHWRLPAGFRVGIGAGPGIGRGLGTPRYRTLLSLEWTLPVGGAAPAYKLADTDDDGIPDYQDACPQTKGTASDVPELNGCAGTLDRDRDGERDDIDACPDVPGFHNPDPAKNGCPLSASPQGS